MSVNKTIKLASCLLGIGEETLAEYATELEDLADLKATYYGVPVKGGDALIVSDAGEVLYANSSVGPSKHIQAWKDGIRTPLSDFGL